MKPIALIALVVLFASFIGGEPKKDFERSNLKGKVKTMVVTEYNADSINKHGEMIGKQITDITTYKYNSKGKVIEKYGVRYGFIHDTSWLKVSYKYYKDTLLAEIISYDSSDITKMDAYTFPHKSEYRYDTIRGLCIEEMDYENLTHLLSAKKYKYDSFGNKIEESEYSSMEDGTSSLKLRNIIKYQYDLKNNKIEKSGYTPAEDDTNNLKSGWRIRYWFDSRSNEVEEHDYHEGYIATYKYDESNNKTEEVHFDKDSSIRWRVVLAYDDKRNLTREETFTYKQERNGTDQMADYIKIYKYDNEGNITEEWNTNKSNGKTFKTIYVYDSQNHLMDIKDFDENGRLYHEDRMERTYDKAGNWIKDLYYLEHNAIGVTERRIEYYQ